MTGRRFTIVDLRQKITNVNKWLEEIPGEWRLEIAQDATGTYLRAFQGKNLIETIGGGTMRDNIDAAANFYNRKYGQYEMQQLKNQVAAFQGGE